MFFFYNSVSGTQSFLYWKKLKANILTKYAKNKKKDTTYVNTFLFYVFILLKWWFTFSPLKLFRRNKIPSIILFFFYSEKRQWINWSRLISVKLSPRRKERVYKCQSPGYTKRQMEMESRKSKTDTDVPGQASRSHLAFFFFSFLLQLLFQYLFLPLLSIKIVT